MMSESAHFGGGGNGGNAERALAFTRREPHRETTPSADQQSLDWLLGQLDDGTAARVGAANGADPELARRTHEADAFLSRIRRLEAPPAKDGFWLRVNCAVRRRLALRPPTAMPGPGWWRQAWRVACVAAVVLGATQLEEAWRRRGSAPSVELGSLPLPPIAATPRVAPPPTDDVEAFVESMLPPPAWARGDEAFFARVDALSADEGADAVLAWLGARNALDSLRLEFRQRFSRQDRQSMLVATGAQPARDDRVQWLAAEVARKLGAELNSASQMSPADPYAVALGLRGLLAAGSSLAVGEHRLLVRAATDVLVARLADDPPEDVVASLLAAITDVAVVSGGRESDSVRRQAERLARATCDLGGVRRPTLLQRQTRLSSLADAGYVLRLAPAFGAPTALCARARRLVLAHLQERLDVSVERPDVIAAMLCGFGDLVDVVALDVRLLLWNVRQLLPDYVVLLHYAWGQYPVRRGWANFQDDLRYLSTLPTPASLVDASALLMTLATNFAAPGSMDLIARR